MPKIGTSHTIPTRAPAPPGSRLKSLGDQCCNSPMRRSKVTARVMTAGTTISRRMESVARGPGITLPPELHYFFAVRAEGYPQRRSEVRDLVQVSSCVPDLKE